MNKNKKCIKKILSFALALVMFFSPIFLSGCFDGVTSNGIGSNQNQQTTPNNPTGGSAGGNSGGNSGETTGSEQDDEEDLDDRESLQYEQYDDFFKNYRITYNPKLNIDRTTFTEELDKQNVSVANKIVSQLELEYKVGTKTIKDVNENSIEVSSSLFSNNIDNSDLRIDDTNIFYLIKQPKTDYVIDVNNSTLEYFSHEHAITEDNNQFGNTGWVAKDDTTGGILADYKTNIQFAELLILAGYTLEEDGSGDFDSEYRSHLDSSGKVRSEDFEDIYAKVNHLGFTQSEMRQIQYYVLNYIIGKNLVDYDNTRFVNVYYDGGYAKVVKNNNYNRFLTDETYATAMEETSSNFANGSLIDYTSTSNIDEIN